MSHADDICPLCHADLKGQEIPVAYREHYGNATHYSRLIAISDMRKDRVVEYQCPDCKGRWLP